MAIRDIVKIGDPVLRRRATKVHRIDGSIRHLIDDLVDTLHEAHGAGLAAPQIGVPLRAIVTNVDDNLHVVVNPEIVDRSEEMVEGEEACLSIPGWYAPVMRHERVTVRGLARTGKPLKIKSEGWEARCFQHEVDHLNGVLYIDRLEDKSLLKRVETKEEEEELEEEQALA